MSDDTIEKKDPAEPNHNNPADKASSDENKEDGDTPGSHEDVRTYQLIN